MTPILSPLDPDLQLLRDEQVELHLPLVKKIAGTLFSQRYFDGVPFEEYVQLGLVGLLQAIDRYDSLAGAKFETYAQYRIKGAIMSGLEKATEVNQQVVTLRRVARERIESLISTPSSATASPAVVDAQGSFDRLVEVSLGLAVAFMLEDSALFRSGEGTCWDNGENNLAYKQLQQRLGSAMTVLTDRERTVMESHYFEHDSFDVIAQNISLTKGRVSQLHRQALSKLRQALTVRPLGELEG